MTGLLLRALYMPEPEARANWREWRERADLDRLDSAVLRVLPMVARGRPEWLQDDPAAAILLGLCRRAWTQNQLRFHLLARTAAALREAGVEQVSLTGSTAFALLSSRNKSLRPLETLELLVSRAEVPAAYHALAAAGWKLSREYPSPHAAAPDHLQAVWLEDARGERLQLGWRQPASAPNPADLLHTRVYLPPNEELLAEALLTARESCELDWRWDALSLTSPSQAPLPAVQWPRVAILLDGNEAALARLRELRDKWNVVVPAALLRPASSGFLHERVRAIRRDHAWHVARGSARSSATGLAAYCARRWWRVFVRGSDAS